MERGTFERDGPCLLAPEHVEWLVATDFCDHEHPHIRALAEGVTRGAGDSREAARALFYWVRDSIRYNVGLQPQRASETVQRRLGACSNKANAFVALLRASGIPACFHVIRVDTLGYFGAFCPLRITRHFQPLGVHVFTGVYLQRWLQCDNTDDFELCRGARHLHPGCTPVEFSGHEDARLLMDPAHIVLEDGRRHASVDALLRKESKLHPIVPATLNLFGDFARAYGRGYATHATIQAAFFTWFAERHPDRHQAFLQFECDYDARARGGAGLR
jgi:Transglutaminase-like superfamily